MKLPYSTLPQHLLKKTLAPLYFLCSNEPLLLQEAVATIRNTARQQGWSERVSITVETGTEWEDTFYAHTHGLSLFSAKKIVELNLTQTKLTAAIGKVLAEYAARPNTDTLLIISTAKLDANNEKSAWYKSIEKTSIVIPIWPIAPEQFAQWILQRAQSLQLTITQPVAKQLAAQLEGNLLAAAQEIEKLHLLQMDGTQSSQAIADSITDNSRFDIFNWVESVLLGQQQRCLRILKNLMAEDTEPTLILWALARELRMLTDMLKKIQEGATLGELFKQFFIWEKRQPSVRAFLQRHNSTRCLDFFLHAAKIDRIIKGAESGLVWIEFQTLALKIASKPS